MARWLLKTEPSTYSWDDLVRERKATWDGITNATALIHLRNMKRGDLAIIYHTGDERQAVGIAEIASNPRPDAKDRSAKLVVVDIKPKSKLPRAVTLDTIKSDPAFKGWDLLRITRLSVVPVPDAMWKRIEELSRGDNCHARGKITHEREQSNATIR
jgi:predicted RNA-binding protein with PUA-like domain